MNSTTTGGRVALTFRVAPQDTAQTVYADEHEIGIAWQCRQGPAPGTCGNGATPCGVWHGTTRYDLSTPTGDHAIEHTVTDMPTRESAARALLAVRTAWSQMYEATSPGGSDHPDPDQDDHCEQCGAVDFLSRNTDDPDLPAWCTSCHEEADTPQWRADMMCEDGCPKPTDHTGLCFNQEPRTCKLCGKNILISHARRHDGGWIGEQCCWDDRLRSTE